MRFQTIIALITAVTVWPIGRHTQDSFAVTGVDGSQSYAKTNVVNCSGRKNIGIVSVAPEQRESISSERLFQVVASNSDRANLHEAIGGYNLFNIINFVVGPSKINIVWHRAEIMNRCPRMEKGCARPPVILELRRECVINNLVVFICLNDLGGASEPNDRPQLLSRVNLRVGSDFPLHANEYQRADVGDEKQSGPQHQPTRKSINGRWLVEPPYPFMWPVSISVVGFILLFGPHRSPPLGVAMLLGGLILMATLGAIAVLA